MNEVIARAYQFEIRAEKDEDEKGVITGRPIVFEQKTDIGGMFEETIAKGALDKTDLKDVRFMVNHDLNELPLARSRKNTKNSTMQMTVDEDGMGIRVKLDTENNVRARELYSAIKRGDVTGMSFMFSIRKDEWIDLEGDYPKRRITDIERVLEVSAVTFPAYEGTSIETAKRDKQALDNAKLALENARSQTVDTVNAIELLKIKNKILGGI